MARGQRPLGWLFDFLAGNPQGEPYEVLPLVQPTIDVSDVWPRKLEVLNLDIASAAAGTNNFNIRPVENESILVYFMFAAQSAPGSNKNWQTFFESNDAPGTDRCQMVFVDGGAQSALGFPVIGGLTLSATPIRTFSGIPPFLIPEGYTLRSQFLAQAGAEVLTVRAIIQRGTARQPLRP